VSKSKMHSRCFGIMEGHRNFAFYIFGSKAVCWIRLYFSKFEVINSINA
jgi:hypothetical protein